MTTVTEAIQMLRELEEQGQGDFQLMFSRPSGDYWKTQLADSVDSFDVGYVAYTDYHQQNQVLDGDNVEEIFNNVRVQGEEVDEGDDNGGETNVLDNNGKRIHKVILVS